MSGENYMDKRVLIRTYKSFKRSPNKIFINRDFSQLQCFRERYLNPLIILGLIEQVKTVYQVGQYANARRDVKGYKFLNRNKEETKKP